MRVPKPPYEWTKVSFLLTAIGVFFIWWEFAPSNTIGDNMLAGLIMGLCIFGIIKLWPETIR